jgi:hypothetical protein
MKTSERIGQKFNRLTFIETRPTDGRKAKRGLFRCECGTEKEAQLNAVFYGSTKSCGCMMKEYYESGTVRSHGDHRSLEYKSWAMMKQRCYNPHETGFARYGGRGIAVCDWWADSYENFLADMGRKPSPAHSLDRIDNDGDYEPGNCRWANRHEQQANRRTSRLLTYNGETMTMLQWAERLGMSWTSLANRAKRGMTDEQILTTPRRNYPR